MSHSNGVGVDEVGVGRGGATRKHTHADLIQQVRTRTSTYTCTLCRLRVCSGGIRVCLSVYVTF